MPKERIDLPNRFQEREEWTGNTHVFPGPNLCLGKCGEKAWHH
jgi:hypothetical protein